VDGRRGDWRTILLAMAGVGAALFAYAIAAFTVLLAAVETVSPGTLNDAQPLLNAILQSSALAVIGTAFLPSAYYGIQRLRGRDVPAASPKPLRLWQGILLFFLWAGTGLLAQVFLNQGFLKWVTPPLYLVAVGVPVYFLLRLVAGGLRSGSRLRNWGVLSTSIALAMPFSVAAEIGMIVVGVIGVGVYVGLHPDQYAALQGIAEKLSNITSIEQTLDLIGPWLSNPLIIPLALLFFSGLTPLIEETAKSFAIWTVFDHLDSPAQGFVAGAISGAGFGLIESLMVSAAPDANWAATLLVRGGSSMMHIATASLTGWGIATFHLNRRLGWMAATYAAAMFIHSLWNACVVFVVAGSLRTMWQSNTPDLVAILLILLGGGTLLVMCLALPVILAGINWRLRAAIPAPLPALPPVSPAAASGPRPGGGPEG
jgi:protease prsW family protein